MSYRHLVKMSTAKMLVKKYENGPNFKSLYVTIPEEDTNAEIKFGEWIEGTIQLTKKESEKTSRLVVKIVSGEETKKIDLDKCAIEIRNGLNLRSYRKESMFPTQSDEIIGSNRTQETDNSAPGLSNEDLLTKTPIQHAAFNDLDLRNPLEQSLQKVKENNARIMENINILNRTLDYTKRKEIFDIISPKSLRTFPCSECGKCFVYETGLRRHYAMRHSMAEVLPRWQVVWTCIQCFQVWPSQDQALTHSAECCKELSDSQGFVRDIKTSLLLQCEFCEKVFTSIPRLLRHSKIHTTDINYECKPCGLAFVSYKKAEQHWSSCPWLKVFYSFSLPKMLLCNACDRKFRNYEQLYNHRYKMGHFLTKMHSVTTSQSLGGLVYQCELCSQWYNSISQIISHRSQHHPCDTGVTDFFGNHINEGSISPLENEYYWNPL